MSWLTAGAEPPPTAVRWFVLVAGPQGDRVVDRFEAPGWAPAIHKYVERMRSFPGEATVSLREARPEEIPAAAEPVGCVVGP